MTESVARLVQSGEGDKRLVVLLYLIHPDLHPVLREVLGPKPMILAQADDGDPGPGIGSAVGQPAFLVDGLVLGGWSAGCLGVRKRLLEMRDLYWSSKLRGLVLADGMHASLPPQPWQLDVWRPWIEKAREGELCPVCSATWKFRSCGACNGCGAPAGSEGRLYPFTFAASHTYQTYVEHLPGGVAYSSTVNVLRKLSGAPLDALGITSPHEPKVRRDGSFYIESWDSSTVDGKAHARQQTEALPGMLARYFRPLAEDIRKR